MKRRGFTLIELLVVVAIMALLISILLPSLGRARQVARKTYCMANLREIGKGLFYYAQDHNDFFPVIHGTDYEHPVEPNEEWWELLLPYKFAASTCCVRRTRIGTRPIVMPTRGTRS